MSRGLSTTNTAQVNASHLEEVILVKLEFDTPVYVHSGIGTITYDSNDYIGVGHYGGIEGTRESEALGPTAITLTLDGITSQHINEALDSGNLYDVVTIYCGYRQDDGTLHDNPWIVWKGWYEYAAIRIDAESTVQITCQHDLSRLGEKKGRRYTHEDQQEAYSGDNAFRFVARMANLKLRWGGESVGIVGSGGGGWRPGDPQLYEF